MDAALRIDTLKNCKDWLAQLPLTNARQAHSLLLAQTKLLDAATAAIWNDVIALWFALVQGYQACADAGVMHLALIHQRAMRYSGLAMQDHNRIYRALLKPEDVPRKIPASLIMTPTAYQSNRPVDLYIDTQQSAKLPSLLDKGVNFERATFVAG